MAEAPSSKSNDLKKPTKPYKVGDLVWGKVKGYCYWPGQIIDPDSEEVPHSSKTPSKGSKNKHCVKFYNSGKQNIAFIGEDMLKHYEEGREANKSNQKSQSFRTAVNQADSQSSIQKGGKPLEPLNTSSSNISNSSIADTTPKQEKEKSNQVFKSAKKVNVVSTPLQRDYSRTPFKKEKRPFDSSIDISTDSPHKKTPNKSSIKSESTDKKRVKIEVTKSPKKENASPTKSIENLSLMNDDFLSEGPIRSIAEDKIEKVKPRTSKIKPSNLKFGFIGLGQMGQEVLKHLLSAGHEISIWNRTITKCKEFETLGANVQETPGDVIRESDITFSCLSDSDAASKIFFGNCGVSKEINASKGYVELTSIDPTTSMDIEAEVKKRGGRYLEAPLISSVPKQIEEGKLVAMVSGNRSLFDDCGTCFEAICSHVYFLAESAGTASKMNIIMGSLYGNIMGSLLESLTLVERLGLLPKDFVEIISQSPFSSPMIMSKAQSMLDSTLVREIPLNHIRRDLVYALQLSNTSSVTAPITAITNEVFKQKQHHYY